KGGEARRRARRLRRRLGADQAGARAHSGPPGAGGASAQDRAGHAVGRHGASHLQLGEPGRALVQLRRRPEPPHHRCDEGLHRAHRHAPVDQPRHGAARGDSEVAAVRPMKELVISLVLGTATPGGGFPVYGDAFAEMVNAQEPTLRVQPRNTKGSGENVPLLEAGKLDLALVAGEVANPALAKPDTRLRIITAIYATPGMFIVRADSPHRTISDLKGRPVVMGAQASGVTLLGRNVLQALGVEVQPIFLEKAADGPAMVTDGRAAAMWGAGVGWPAFIALAKAGGRFIALDAEEIKAI